MIVHILGISFYVMIPSLNMRFKLVAMRSNNSFEIMHTKVVVMRLPKEMNAS